MAFHWSTHHVLLSCMTGWSKPVACEAYAGGTSKVPVMKTDQSSVLHAQLQQTSLHVVLLADSRLQALVVHLPNLLLSDVSHFTGTGGTYIFRFPTRKGYSNIRMPFNAFRPSSPGEPSLDSNNVNLTDIAIRFEPGGRYMANEVCCYPLYCSN